jgi:hypothetical protein
MPALCCGAGAQHVIAGGAGADALVLRVARDRDRSRDAPAGSALPTAPVARAQRQLHLRVVPASGTLSTKSRPPSAPMRSLSPTSPDAADGGAADAADEDANEKRAVDSVELEVDAGGLRVLGGVRECLGGDEVRADLDRLREPIRCAHVQPQRHDGAACERPQCRGEAALRQDRGVNAARHLAQVVQHARDRAGDLGQLRFELVELTRDGRLRAAEVKPQRDEPLLAPSWRSRSMRRRGPARCRAG